MLVVNLDDFAPHALPLAAILHPLAFKSAIYLLRVFFFRRVILLLREPPEPAPPEPAPPAATPPASFFRDMLFIAFFIL